MATKKTSPTLEELNAQIAALQAKAEALRTSEMAGIVAGIRKAIAHYGLTAADLGFGGTKPKAARPAAKAPAGKSKGKAAPAKRETNVKFGDGQGHAWSGVGKLPNWYKDAIAAGKTPEDLLVKAAG